MLIIKYYRHEQVQELDIPLCAYTLWETHLCQNEVPFLLRSFCVELSDPLGRQVKLFLHIVNIH